jgi:hypothetical protein
MLTVHLSLECQPLYWLNQSRDRVVRTPVQFMKRSHTHKFFRTSNNYFAFVVGLWLVLTSGCKTESHQDPESPQSKTTSINHVRLVISVHSQSLEGKPVNLTIKLSNFGNRAVFYSKSTGFINCEVHVCDHEGNVLHPTQFGRELHLSSVATGHGGRLIIFALDPNQTEAWVLDLAKCFAMPPGHYTLSFSMPLNELQADSFVIGVKELDFFVN